MSESGLILPDSEAQTGYAPIEPAPDPTSEENEINIEQERIKRVYEGSKGELPANALTGFVCILTNEGQWIGHNAINAAADIKFSRELTMNDMISGGGIVASDMTSKRDAVMTSQELMRTMAMQAQMAQAEMEKQRIMQTLQNPANHLQGNQPRRR